MSADLAPVVVRGTEYPYAVAVRTTEAATDFAVVDGITRHWFHGHLPADPADTHGVWVDYSWADREHVIYRCGRDGDPTLGIFWMLNQWLNATSGRNPAQQPPLPVFFPADPADLDWFADAFDRAGLPPRFVRDAEDHKPFEPIADALTYVLDSKQHTCT